MSDSLEFVQKISISAMTEQRLHISVLKQHLLDMRRAARYKYSTQNNQADIYKIVKDANQITDQGLFRLTEDSFNYDNPVPGPDRLPDLDYAFLYVIPFTDQYIRQYTLIATDGYTTIKTRLGTYISSKLYWGPWRPYSDNNPMYELLSTTEAKVNENYLSFGEYELELPNPKLCKVGDVIRLDQWKNSGSVTLRNHATRGNTILKYISTYPSVLGTCKKMKCTGLIPDKTVIFEHRSETLWVSDTFVITTQMFSDVFYWVILNNGSVKYKSVESIFTKTSPASASYTYFEEGTVATNLSFEVIQTSDEPEDIWTCNTYEFEIFNDIDIHNTNHNYWCVFIFNYMKNSYSKSEQFYTRSFNNVYSSLATTNARITETSRLLQEYINSVSAQISSCISNVIAQHTSDIADIKEIIQGYHPPTPVTPTEPNT